MQVRWLCQPAHCISCSSLLHDMCVCERAHLSRFCLFCIRAHAHFSNAAMDAWPRDDARRQRLVRHQCPSMPTTTTTTTTTLATDPQRCFRFQMNVLLGPRGTARDLRGNILGDHHHHHHHHHLMHLTRPNAVRKFSQRTRMSWHVFVRSVACFQLHALGFLVVMLMQGSSECDCWFSVLFCFG